MTHYSADQTVKVIKLYDGDTKKIYKILLKISVEIVKDYCELEIQ